MGQAVHTTAGSLPFSCIVHVAVKGYLWSVSEHSVRLSVRSAVEMASGLGHSTLVMPVLRAGAGLTPDRAFEIVMDALGDPPLQVTVARLPPAMRKHIRRPYREAWSPTTGSG